MTMLAVSTGLDSFSNPEEIGPMWPFEGLEWLFVVVAVVLWLGWHILQARAETRQQNEAVAAYEQIGMDRVMVHGSSALSTTDEEWAAAQAQAQAHSMEPPAGRAPAT